MSIISGLPGLAIFICSVRLLRLHPIHIVVKGRRGASSLDAGLKVKVLLGLGLSLKHLLQRQAPVNGLVCVGDAHIKDTALTLLQESV